MVQGHAKIRKTDRKYVMTLPAQFVKRAGWFSEKDGNHVNMLVDYSPKHDALIIRPVCADVYYNQILFDTLEDVNLEKTSKKHIVNKGRKRSHNDRIVPQKEIEAYLGKDEKLSGLYAEYAEMRKELEPIYTNRIKYMKIYKEISKVRRKISERIDTLLESKKPIKTKNSPSTR
jgi:hypothetical protein